MKPWQAWVVTICSIISCLVLVHFWVSYMVFVNEMNKFAHQLTGGHSYSGGTTDLEARLKKHKEDIDKAGITNWLPKKPSGKVIVNPPER